MLTDPGVWEWMDITSSLFAVVKRQMGLPVSHSCLWNFSARSVDVMCFGSCILLS